MQPPLPLESRSQALSDDLFHLRKDAVYAQLAENIVFSYKVSIINLDGSTQSHKGESKGKDRVLDRFAQHIFDIATSVIVEKLVCQTIENPKNSELVEFQTRETKSKPEKNQLHHYSGHFMVTFSDEAAGPVKIIRIELNYTGVEHY
jgi:hypothetical protein